MIECRLARAGWLLFAGAVAAGCGGKSVSRLEGGDAGAEHEVLATGGDAGGGSSATGVGGVGGASSGGLGGAGGRAPSGNGGAGGTGGQRGEVPCPDILPPGMSCGGDLVGTWAAAACSLTVSGVVSLASLGLSAECATAPVTGSLRVSGTVTFDEVMKYSDYTTTSGESTFELAPACLEVSGTKTTCKALESPLKTLGYDSLTCASNAVNGGCTCTGTVLQTGGLAYVSYSASTNGTYATASNGVTLTSLEDGTHYSYCVSPDARLLTLSLQTAAMIGTVADPIVLVKP